jgi:hypothetical protein
VKTLATIAAVVLCLACGTGMGQEKSDPPPYVAPPEITILKHVFGSDHRFVTEAVPQSKTGGEPATTVVPHSFMSVSVKAKSNANKRVVGVSWYFTVSKNTGEEIFNVPFITPVDIASQQTKTFKGEIERLPRRPQTVTVEELKDPVKTPARIPPLERVVITCVLFADGTSSPLTDAARDDCRRLQASPEIRKKIEKL